MTTIVIAPSDVSRETFAVGYPHPLFDDARNRRSIEDMHLRRIRKCHSLFNHGNRLGYVIEGEKAYQRWRKAAQGAAQRVKLRAVA